MQNELSKLPPPPRVISAFASGFEAIANHITLIALPVLVDLFLWLGPHLKLGKFLQPWFDHLQDFTIPIGSISASDIELAKQGWMEFTAGFNLFSVMRTFPVGPASLMSGRMPVETPLGAPISLQPSSLFSVAGWGLLTILAGWIVGSLYFHSVSATALSLPRRSVLTPMLQVVVLSIVWIAALGLISIPVLFLFTLLNLFSPALAQTAMFLLAMLALWVMLPVFFSPHGIFTGHLDAFAAIRSSLKMVRYTLPTSGLFLMGFILISQGLDFLWRTPPEISWWTLVGITGHAFISTALLAASFVYYRDVNAWLTAILEQLKGKSPAPVKIGS